MDSGGKGGYQKPRTVYFAGRDDLPSEPQAYMAHRGDFTTVPPPTEMDARPATPTLPHRHWSLVPGQGWDQEMLLQQENSDVVMDRLIAQNQAEQAMQTSGPPAGSSADRGLRPTFAQASFHPTARSAT